MLEDRSMSQPSSWKVQVLVLLLFSTAFGYLEAAVVSYLRYLHEPIRQHFYPGRPSGELFPLLTREQVMAAGEQARKVLVTEIGREAATILMLAAVALALSTKTGQWAAAFGIAFGIWDITFYVFLKVLLGWPASLLTWDILFLIPAPWAGPVLAPVLVSAAMITGGVWQLRSAARGSPVHLGGRHWAGVTAGAAVILWAFTFDSANILAGGLPHPFHWGILSSGLGIGTLGYVSAAVQSNTRRKRAAAP
jgi:hypothetical protein